MARRDVRGVRRPARSLADGDGGGGLMAPDIPDWLGALIAFVFGASIGSFVNVVAYRLPREISIATPRSFCPACNRSIPWWTNIPILAYLGLRGRCIMCGAPIAFRHFLAEIALAVT